MKKIIIYKEDTYLLSKYIEEMFGDKDLIQAFQNQLDVVKRLKN